MSNVYNLAPPTKGKVLLKTSLGDIDIELWAKEAPKATRNFVQLCMEGYYDSTIFHRVIKDFMVQGGDPTGTGKGGDSIYGGPFKDEFHSRLRFTHRGIVACANENEANSNGSQFFITQEACPHLDKKHTIFGKVVGDSIYNVAHFNQLETDKNDRPNDPPKLLSTEILWNPFDDIVPRTTPEEREAEAAAKREAEAVAARLDRKKRKRNLGLLSFGEEAGNDEAEATADKTLRLRSTFEADRPIDAEDKDLDDADADAPAEKAQRLKARLQDAAIKAEEDDERPDLDTKAQSMTLDERLRAKVQQQRDRTAASKASQKPPEPSAGSDEEENDEEPAKKKKSKRDRQREALESGAISHAAVQPSKLLNKQDTNLLSEFEKRRLKAKERSKLSKQSRNSMAQLLAFKKQLSQGKGGQALNTAVKSSKKAVKQEVKEEDEEKDGDDQQLPAAWRIDRFLDDYEDEDFSSIATHKLQFLKAKAKSDLMARNHDDDYMVHDPLADKQQAWNAKEGAERRRNREWAADVEGPLD